MNGTASALEAIACRKDIESRSSNQSQRGIEISGASDLRECPAHSDWHTRVATILALDELETLLAVFRAQSIPVIVLKGAALALALYDDPGQRRLGDVDLLVRPGDVQAVGAMLEAQGFAPLTEMQPDFGTAYRNERTFLRRTPPALQIDLHWHLSARDCFRRRLPMDWFWEHAVPLHVGKQQALMLNPEAMLLHLCMHASQHGNRSERWSYDIALLLERWPLNWDEVLAVARQSGLALALQITLASVEELWRVKPPAAACEQLARLPVDWRQRMLQRFWAAPDTSGLNLVDALNEPDLRRTMGMWLRIAFPSREYMRCRYGITNDRALIAGYFRRACTGGKRVVRSINQAVTA